MPDPGENKKISELDASATFEDTDEIVIARPGAPYANFSVTGEIVKASAKPAGSDKQVQFNDNGLMGASSGLTFDKSTGLFSAPKFAAAKQPNAMLTASTDLVLTSGVTTDLSAFFNTVVYDNGSNKVSGYGRFKVPAGVYMLFLKVTLEGTLPESCISLWAIDGYTDIYAITAYVRIPATTLSSSQTIQCSGLYKTSAAAYFQPAVTLTTSGGVSGTLRSAYYHSSFAISRVA